MANSVIYILDVGNIPSGDVSVTILTQIYRDKKGKD